jgi:hypothetical protein
VAARSHRSHRRCWSRHGGVRTISGMAEPSSTVAPAATAVGPTVEHVVAETMRRVHEQLRGGRAPSFEALLAFGEPA